MHVKVPFIVSSNLIAYMVKCLFTSITFFFADDKMYFIYWIGKDIPAWLGFVCFSLMGIVIDEKI